MCIFTLLSIGLTLSLSVLGELHLHKDEKECIIERKLFWLVYEKHFGEAKMTKVIILSDTNHEQELHTFSNNFLKSLYQYLMFMTGVEIQYKSYSNIEKISPLTTPHYIFAENVTTEDKAYSKINEAWKRTTRFSADVDSVVVIIVRDIEILLQAFHADFRLKGKHNRSLHLILFTFSSSTECSEFPTKIGELLHFLWNTHQIFNVLVQSACACACGNIYIFRPFHRIKEGKYGVLEVLSLKNDERSIRHMMNIMTNMHKKSLSISIFERVPTASTKLNKFMEQNFLYQNLYLSHGYSGVDGSILENFSRLMNFSAELIGCEPPIDCFGHVFRNETITGSLGLIVSGKAELSSNGRFLKDYHTSDIEFTNAIYSDIVCPIVRKAKITPNWMYLYKAFDNPSWICIVLTISISVLIWFLLKSLEFPHTTVLPKRDGKRESRTDSKQYFIDKPKSIKMTLSQGLFLSTILLSSVIFIGVFQGILVKSFSVITRLKDVESLQELIDGNFKILSALNIFTGDRTKMMQKLNDRIVFRDMDSLTAVLTLENFATLERKQDAQYYIKLNYTNKDNEPLLHIVEECPSSYFIAYIVPLGSPYLKRFNNYISAFGEAGLIAYWYNMMIVNLIHGKIMQENSGCSGKFHPFTLDDVQFPFILLIVGLVLSSFILFFEFCVCFCQKKYIEYQRK